MFAETLLESSTGRKRKRWPMATAFTVQTIIAAIVVVVPLLSTGVIPLSARITCPIAPLKETPIERVQPRDDSRPRSGPAGPRSTEVVLLANNHPALPFGPPRPATNDQDDPQPVGSYIGPSNLPSNLLPNGDGNGPIVKQEQKRVSVLSEAQIVSRVEPVYPRTAVLAGIQGQVKLHAIIARNGRIESLELMSGPPLLVQAAIDAVRQWRYRPYYLNGEAVEVETFITVNFRKENR
jgi:periplasmic protein TonB